jgi:hypothetical protein
MWQYDFNLFYRAGQAVLAGRSPYTIVDFNPPYPLAVLFALVAWLPEPLVYALYLVGCGLLLWKVMQRKRDILWALLSFPVFFNLFVGQVDLPLALLAPLLGPWVLPILLIKPQVGFVIVPWILQHRKNWKQLFWPAVAGVAFLGICFILRPNWVAEWLARVPTVAQYAQRDSDFYWLVPPQFKTIAIVLGGLIALALAFFLLKKDRSVSWTVLHLFAPLTNIYSASVLAEWMSPWEVALSWLAIFAVGGNIFSGAPLFVVGCSILVRYYLRSRQTAPKPEVSV